MVHLGPCVNACTPLLSPGPSVRLLTAGVCFSLCVKYEAEEDDDMPPQVATVSWTLETLKVHRAAAALGAATGSKCR